MDEGGQLWRKGKQGPAPVRLAVEDIGHFVFDEECLAEFKSTNSLASERVTFVIAPAKPRTLALAAASVGAMAATRRATAKVGSENLFLMSGSTRSTSSMCETNCSKSCPPGRQPVGQKRICTRGEFASGEVIKLPNYLNERIQVAALVGTEHPKDTLLEPEGEHGSKTVLALPRVFEVILLFQNLRVWEVRAKRCAHCRAISHITGELLDDAIRRGHELEAHMVRQA